MKLKECKDWTAVVFSDRVILKKDLPLLSKEQRDSLMELDVAMVSEGRYRPVDKAEKVQG